MAVKTALVTGGSGAIGSAICRALAAQGLQVIVHANNRLDVAQGLAAQLQAGGAKAQARFRLDGSMAYNLFGDPATRIPWPGKATLESAKKTSVGGKLAVTGSADLGDGTAIVTLEAGRLKSLEACEKIDAEAADAEACMKTFRWPA